jgi:hypothetical protein
MIFVTSLTQNPHLAMIDFPNANNLYLYLIYMILWPNPILISSESSQINNKDALTHYMPYSTPLSFQDHPQSIDPLSLSNKYNPKTLFIPYFDYKTILMCYQVISKSECHLHHINITYMIPF